MTNSHPHKDEGLEQIQINLGSAIAHGTYMNEDAREAKLGEIVAAIQSYTQQQCLRVIGEPEDPNDTRQQPGIYYRNNLKAEQRERLAQLTNNPEEGV